MSADPAAPPTPPPGRIAIHVARIAAATRVEEIERAAVEAAIDLTRFDSALVARLDPLGELVVRRAAGPLAEDLEQAPAATLADGGILEAAGHPVLSAPLVARAQPRGALVAAHSQTREPPHAPAHATARDLLELLAAHTALALLAATAPDGPAHDPLTGLPGPVAFAETLTAVTPPGSRAVLLVEVDGFHDLASESGRQAADRHLRSIASAVAGALRSGDELFRVGSDELAAIVAVGEEPEALDAARRLRDAGNAVPGAETVAVGVALPRPGEPPAAVLARAHATRRGAGVWLA